MNFSFTEEQSLLRDSLASYLADHYDFDTRRAALKSEAGWRPEVWRAFADDLGILGAALPEDLGGLGGGATETMVIMEQLGAALVVEPYLGTVVIGGGFLTRSDHPARADLLAKIVAGEAIFAFAAAEPQGRYNWADLTTTASKHGAGWALNGHKAVVVGAPWADHLIGHRPHRRGPARRRRRLGVPGREVDSWDHDSRLSHGRWLARLRGAVRETSPSRATP